MGPVFPHNKAIELLSKHKFVVLKNLNPLVLYVASPLFVHSIN